MRFRLIETVSEQIDGVKVRLGRFEITNHQNDPLIVSGWVRQSGFLVEYPVAQLQIRSKDWATVTPLIGSFISDGDQQLVLTKGKAMFVLARVEFGVLPGKHEMRLSVHTIKGTCLLSEPFIQTVQ